MVLVDGYNVMGRWMEIQTAQQQNDLVPRLTGGSIGDIRELLINELVGYSKHRNLKILCAFDANTAIYSESRWAYANCCT